jgi:hypothetical protein
MSSISHGDHEGYWAALEAEDGKLDDLIGGIRRRQEAGELTPREAANERIQVMEAHLTAVQELRRTHLSGSLQPRVDHAACGGQNFGGSSAGSRTVVTSRVYGFQSHQALPIHGCQFLQHGR